MVRLSIEDIEQDLPAFLQRVEAGEELIITQAGRAVAEIKPIPSPPVEARPFAYPWAILLSQTILMSRFRGA